MPQIRIGDLCVTHDAINHSGKRGAGVVPVSDERVLDTLFDLSEDDMVMVTGYGSASRARDGLTLLLGVLKNGCVPERTQILQVVVASGPHSGMVGFVPEFWLRAVVSSRG